MTSVLNVDTIADKAGTGPVGLTKQEAAKAWSNIDGTGTTVLNDSLNYSSLTDVGGGKTTMTFSNAMASANYSLTTACGLDGDTIFGGDIASASLVTTANHRIQSRDQGGALTDPDIACSQVIGDLA